MKITTLSSNNSINRSPCPLAVLFIPLALGCFALSPQARAVCQEGCDLGNNNTFLGDNALVSNTNGNNNTATGANALAGNTTGYFNTATGVSALQSNAIGVYNTATGPQALYSNIDGNSNTANGRAALYSNTNGFDNTADGRDSLYSNTTGYANTANGFDALFNNTTGTGNTALGDDALLSNTTGNNNTAVGVGALQGNSGSNNIALGQGAGIFLTTGNNNIAIGDFGVLGESRTIRLGMRQTHRTTFIAGISGAIVPTGVAVIVDSSGHLGTSTSSARFKESIKPMDKTSEAILALKPVTFRYKHELDPEGIPQFGLVAEEVEKVNPDLVARDEQGKPYTVRYEAVNAMLLNEFLKEHGKVEELEATMVQQQTNFQATVAELRSALKEQAAQIQKVSAQLAVSKAEPRTVFLVSKLSARRKVSR